MGHSGDVWGGQGHCKDVEMWVPKGKLQVPQNKFCLFCYATKEVPWSSGYIGGNHYLTKIKSPSLQRHFEGVVFYINLKVVFRKDHLTCLFIKTSKKFFF